MTTAPPDTAAERVLLLAWLTRLLPTIADVAGAAHAPRPMLYLSQPPELRHRPARPLRRRPSRYG